MEILAHRDDRLNNLYTHNSPVLLLGTIHIDSISRRTGKVIRNQVCLEIGQFFVEVSYQKEDASPQLQSTDTCPPKTCEYEHADKLDQLLQKS